VQRRNRHLGEFIERFTRVVKMPEPERRPTDLLVMLVGIMRLYREPCRNKGINLEWEPSTQYASHPFIWHQTHFNQKCSNTPSKALSFNDARQKYANTSEK
jgi:hypothetical protein